MFTGEFIKFTPQTLDNFYPGVEGASMAGIRESNGYIMLSQHTENTNDRDDIFQLTTVGPDANSGKCEMSDTVETNDLELEHEVTGLVERDYEIPQDDYALPENDITILEMTCTDFVNQQSSGNLRSTAEKELAYAVSPNPLPTASTEWVLQFEASSDNTTMYLTLSDIYSRRIIHKAIHIQRGSQRIVLPATNIPAGIYVLKIEQEGKIVYETKLIRE
jgi:hypothetical protein